MEKNKNISLDELFARAKGEEPVLSQEDVRAIVSSAVSPVQSKQTTSFISRKGYIMSGLGLITAGAAFIGYMSLGSQLGVVSSQGGSGQWSVASGQLGNGKTETTTPIVEPKKDSKVAKKIIVVRDNGDGTELAIDPNVAEPLPPPTPLLPDGKLMAPVEVESVAIIQAKDEDLPKLGLDKFPGVGLGFYVKHGGDKFKKYYIPEKGWGVAEINIPVERPSVVLQPVVITDSRGNKRYMHFADENTMVHMEQYEGGMPNELVVEDEHISSNDKDFIIKKGTIDNKKVIRAKKTIQNSIVVNQDSAHTVSSMFVIDSVDPKNTKGVVVMMDVDNDEQMPSDFNYDIKIGDSSIKINELVRDAMAKAKVAMKDMKISMDSVRKSMIKIEKDYLDMYPGLDTSIKNLKKQMSSIVVVDQNLTPEEAEKLNKGVMIEMSNFSSTIRDMEVKITAKINKLVPVLVRKATEVKHNNTENRDYDNGVIMWFEPEQFWKQYGDKERNYEVEINGDMLINGQTSTPPQSKQGAMTSISSVVSRVSVYPNPVRSSKTNIHYSLSQPRSLAFSVHDILGKKIVDCGSLAERPQGEYDFDLNIGNIPAGIYLVVITTDKGEQTIQRIVVEK